MEKKNIVDRNVAGTPGLQSVFNFLTNENLNS